MGLVLNLRKTNEIIKVSVAPREEFEPVDVSKQEQRQLEVLKRIMEGTYEAKVIDDRQLSNWNICGTLGTVVDPSASM